MKKALPKFRSEDAELEFWATHDSAEYIDWRKGKRATLPKLRPSSQSISLRLPKPMLDRLKLLANKRDVPYQSLLKMFVAEPSRRSLNPAISLADERATLRSMVIEFQIACGWGTRVAAFRKSWRCTASALIALRSSRPMIAV